jgi:hypothetical protein
MLTASVVVSLLLAIGTWLLAWRARPRPDEEGRVSPMAARNAARASLPLAFGVAFAALAGALALIDEKVSDGGDAFAPAAAGAAAQRTPAVGGSEIPGRVLEYPLETGDLANFAGSVRVGPERTPRALCLVAYFDKSRRLGAGRSYRWWTSCDEDATFDTLGEVHDRLALPAEWGPRTTRAVACVPKGRRMPHVRGETGPKLSHDSGEQHPGGAEQYRVIRFDTRWIVRYDRIDPDARRLPRVGDPCDG